MFRTVLAIVVFCVTSMGILNFFLKGKVVGEENIDPIFLAQLKGKSGKPRVIIGKEIKRGTSRTIKPGVKVNVSKNGKVTYPKK